MNRNKMRYQNSFTKNNYIKFTFIVNKKDEEVLSEINKMKQKRKLSEYIRFLVQKKIDEDKILM